MWRVIGLGATVLFFALPFAHSPNDWIAHSATPNKSKKPQAFGGCKRTYNRPRAHRALRRVYRSPTRLTRFERRLARRVVRCQFSRRSARRMRRHHARYRRTHRRRFYWERRWANVDSHTKRRLATLRWCESTNNPTATNGSHWGYYQYDYATWAEAQSWARVPARRRTARADYASPIAQNVVTASFFPANTGRWACSA